MNLIYKSQVMEVLNEWSAFAEVNGLEDEVFYILSLVKEDIEQLDTICYGDDRK